MKIECQYDKYSMANKVTITIYSQDDQAKQDGVIQTSTYTTMISDAAWNRFKQLTPQEQLDFIMAQSFQPPKPDEVIIIGSAPELDNNGIPLKNDIEFVSDI